MKVSTIIGREYLGHEPNELERLFCFRDENGNWYSNIYGEREATLEEAHNLWVEEMINTPGYVYSEIWGQ